jgi:phosphoribosylformimino-5-aminoimidazole carboxamide ribotide isomerase
MREASDFVILPAIDLRGGRVVRLQQGDFHRETAYDASAVNVARQFVDMGASWLHVVDLDAARSGVAVNRGVIAEIVAAVGSRARVELAGGLRDASHVAAAFETGAARAVVGTAALQDSGFAGRLVLEHGADRIAAAIDVRDGLAVGHGWLKDAAGVEAVDAIARLADVGVATFEVTAIDRDGLLEGPDLALYERVRRLGLGSIIASGGITSLADLRAVRARGCVGAIVGRALYEGNLALTDAIAIADETA